MPFPNTVNRLQAPGVKGDFASTNPYSSIVAGPGALVAPEGGLLVGNFAWVGPAGQVSQSFVSGYQIGFCQRNEQALITEFLGESTLLIPAGFMVTLINGGDLWAEFATGATPGMKVYADPNDGAPIAANSTPTLGTVTAVGGFTGTGTASVAAGTTLTITADTDGLLLAGDVISASDIPTGTTIVAQLTVTAGYGYGSRGTYEMSAAATGSLSGAVTSTSGYFVVTAVADGSLNFGDAVSGSSVAAGTVIGLQNPGFSGTATAVTSTTGLTVNSVNSQSGPLLIGAIVSSNGVTVGTIASQTSGTPGGAGVYVLSADAAINITAAPVVDNSVAGGIGIYAVEPAGQNFASTTVTVAGTAQLTSFTVTGTYTALANEIAKISATAV